MAITKKAKRVKTTIHQSLHHFIASQDVIPYLKKPQTFTALAEAIQLATMTLNQGGRVFTFGAGTSGRLAVLDASEILPTFGIKNLFIGLIAGGKKALTQAVEGAEDDEQILIKQIAKYQPTAQDLMLGVACSGTTPCVLGLLKYAKKKIKAKTILVSATTQSQPLGFVDISICAGISSEYIKGSSRLSCGTFTKIVLNAISTQALVGAGRTHHGLMIFVQPSNHKLRQRIIQIYCQLTGASWQESQDLMHKYAYKLPELLLMHYGSPNLNKAKQLLQKTGGNFQRALDLLQN